MQPAIRLYLSFFACALMLGSWYPRIPDVQEAAGLEGLALGLALSGYPVGILLLFTFGTRLASRMTFTASFRMVVPALGLALIGAVLAPNAPLLFCALLAAGALQGVLAITGNVEADRMEAAAGKSFLVRAHGFYSLATVLAGTLGIGFRAWDVPPWLHLGAMLPAATLLVLAATRGMLPTPGEVEASTGPDRIVRPTAAIIVLFLAGGASLYLDNAASDWSGILLRDGYGAGTVFVTVTVAIWALGQAAGRIAYPNLAAITGNSGLALIMTGSAMAGLVLVVLSQSPLLAVAGLLLMGFGTSALFPMAISAAARLADRSSAANVASISQLAFLAGIATPIVLGGLVQVGGIRLAFASGAVLLAISMAVLLMRRPFDEV